MGGEKPPLIPFRFRGERDPEQLAGLRHKRCKRTAEQFAEYLDRNRREEHLYNLESALQERIAAHERKLEEELQRQACEELPSGGEPSHNLTAYRRGA